MTLRIALQITVLVGLSMITFGSVAGNQFFSVDDASFIEENQIQHVLQLDSKGFFDIWSRPTLGLYIPIPNLAWATLAKMSESSAEDPAKLGHAAFPDQRFDPAVFHLASLVCHVLAGLMVFGSLVLLGSGPWGAFFGAAVFLFHPVQVEGIAWASLLKDLLATLFATTALLFYILSSRRDAHSDDPRSVSFRIYHALAFVFYVFALCSKPAAIVLPLIIGLIGLLILNRPFGTLAKQLIPWALCAIPIVIVTSNVQLEDAAVQYEIVDVMLRPIIALDALTFYLLKLVAPLQLTFDYGRSPESVLESSWTFITWTPPIAIAALVFRERKHHPWLAVACGVFLLGVLPTLGLKAFAFQTFSTVTDHYLNLSMLGVAIGVGFGVQVALQKLQKANKAPASFALVGIALLIALCFKSHSQINHWQTSEAIYGHAIAVNTKSWFSHRMLGLEQELRDDPDQALIHYRRSMAINGNTYGHSELFYRMNEAKDYERALEIISDVVDRHHRDTDYFTRAQIHFSLGRLSDSVKDLEEARRQSPPPDLAARIDRALAELR